MRATLLLNVPQLQVTGSFGLGLWSIETYFYSGGYIYTECGSWSDNLNSYLADGAWNSARGFAICADICIGIATIACIVMTCASVPTLVIKMTAGLFLIGFLFESLVFIAFSSDVCSSTFSCKFSSGAGTAIAALLFALIAAVTAANIRPHTVNEEFTSR